MEMTIKMFINKIFNYIKSSVKRSANHPVVTDIHIFASIETRQKSDFQKSLHRVSYTPPLYGLIIHAIKFNADSIATLL